ncbi:MAG: hypothetical protein E6Q97_16325 [Desulfurellales bacterium]|nr:MAG: hypothetical protein E6Q97_16325 [Desulfurellales bacterium]
MTTHNDLKEIARGKACRYFGYRRYTRACHDGDGPYVRDVEKLLLEFGALVLDEAKKIAETETEPIVAPSPEIAARLEKFGFYATSLSATRETKKSIAERIDRLKSTMIGQGGRK